MLAVHIIISACVRYLSAMTELTIIRIDRSLTTLHSHAYQSLSKAAGMRAGDTDHSCNRGKGVTDKGTQGWLML